ncbi:MAG: DUF4391 domain-containing protein [Gammaproteobacteria bacterium]
MKLKAWTTLSWSHSWWYRPPVANKTDRLGMAFFDYPAGTQFGRIIPKSKILQDTKPTATVRKQFTSHIDRIIWAYKLAPTTLKAMAGGPDIEIQVLTLALKTGHLDDAVLRTIDKAIPHATIFELTYGEQRCVRAAYKRPSEAGGDKWVVVNKAYFGTEWQSSMPERQKLPTAIDMDQLYQALLKSLLPIAARTRETLEQHIARCAEIKALQKQITRLQGARRSELQYKKQMAMNTELKEAKLQMQVLTAGDAS